MGSSLGSATGSINEISRGGARFGYQGRAQAVMVEALALLVDAPDQGVKNDITFRGLGNFFQIQDIFIRQVFVKDNPLEHLVIFDREESEAGIKLLAGAGNPGGRAGGGQNRVLTDAVIIEEWVGVQRKLAADFIGAQFLARGLPPGAAENCPPAPGPVRSRRASVHSPGCSRPPQPGSRAHCALQRHASTRG